MKTTLLFFVLIGITLSSPLNPNLNPYNCDTSILSSENLCIFVQTDGSATGPHMMDRNICPD